MCAQISGSADFKALIVVAGVGETIRVSSAMPPTKDSSPAKAPRTEKFSVGAAVEALDDQQLWYPATLVEERKDAVLVAFDGWSSQWNEWVAKDSKRLRPPRGWGTAKKPDDWQAESTILALDMEGKWYPAKVLHVSELRGQVHYQRWSSKWDEWIDKDAGRLRKLDEPPGADEQEAKGAATSAVSGFTRDDTHDDVCAVCEEPGELVCCDGPCKRVFHEGCVPPNNPIESGSRWLCADCRTRRYRCFVCKKWGAARTELVMCPKKACGKWYHGECLQASLQPFSALEEEHRLAAADDAADDGADDDDGEAEAEEEVWADESQWAQRPAEKGEDFALASPTRAAAAAAAAAAAEAASSPERASDGTVRAVPTPPRQRIGDGAIGAAGAIPGRGGAIPGRPAALVWAGVCCARHWCDECGQVESNGYGKAMVHCVRCCVAYHRSCAVPPQSSMITHRTFLCGRCYHNSPKGLNAPDPVIPARTRREAEVLWIDTGDVTAAPFAQTKLKLKQVGFEPPPDLMAALRNRAILPGPGFAPVPYTPLKRSVYAHKRQRETLPES